MLQSFKKTKNITLKIGIQALSKEILSKTQNIKHIASEHTLYKETLSPFVVQLIQPKYININEPVMKLGDMEVANSKLAESFVDYFDKKVKNTVNMCRVDDDVYNGKKAFIPQT